MPAHAAYILVGLLAAAPAAADTSERFREVMSACTLPGPGVEERIDRLTGIGWQSAEDIDRIVSFRADALAIGNPADDGDWPARRAWARGLAIDATQTDAGAWLGQGDALVQISPQSETGFPTCFLATTNSTESELLLSTLTDFGAVVESSITRRASFVSDQTDADGQAWRTTITLVSASDGALDPPLTTTLTAAFVTRPER